ncbi:hypothetical protein [Bradyrhizobium quebecense]|uniref:Uncharacterized protein n=2 Tax=Bradyrhizobium quebecense TaxID=2748629 RepID=A0ABS3MBB0_9BRAD|nr:hypothetical protein [Bradyrhizobium quebecense]UGY04102.1 hypothetical protein J4P68_0004865 [Bradyrhizobium quebecense]
MNRLLLVAMAIVTMKIVCQNAIAQDRPPNPGFNAQMETIRKEVDRDMQGPLAKEAIVACRRVAGISVPVQTAPEAIRSGYSAEVAFKFADCVANYMYPIDARKIEELDKKASRR